MSTRTTEPPAGRKLAARDAVFCVLVTMLVLALVEGPSMRSSAKGMDPGIKRKAVRAVGGPAGWLGDRLPLADLEARLSSWLSPDQDAGPGGFTSQPAPGTSGGDPGPVTPAAFAPGAVQPPPAPAKRLARLLVTGDSMSQPLDTVLARRLAPEGIAVTRDAHLGTAISSTSLVDWGALSLSQARKTPEATVVLIGANEGFPMRASGQARRSQCCTPTWAAEYATRVRRMMAAYRQSGRSVVYWLTLPLPREAARAKISRTVNAAIRVAAEPYADRVRVVEIANLITPGGHYRDAMDIRGKEQIVRDPDGVHLNQAGATVAAYAVVAAIGRDFITG